RSPVGNQIDDADAAQREQRLADRGVADAEALGQFLGDEVLAGPQPALEHVAQQRLHNTLTSQTTMIGQRRGAAGNGHVLFSIQIARRPCQGGTNNRFRKKTSPDAQVGFYDTMIYPRVRGRQAYSIEFTQIFIEVRGPPKPPSPSCFSCAFFP